MTLISCSKTGFVHRLFDITNADEPRHSIGTICPTCAVDLHTHDVAMLRRVRVEDVQTSIR